MGWHSDTRGPQVYRLYAADVDTRPKEGEGGGQYGVSISDSGGVLGKYRYLLFDVSRTEATDPFGNTFYSEIDVDDGKARKVVTPPAPEPRREIVDVAGGAYQITIDATESPDLTQWAHAELAPVVPQWYPKIVKMLPSEGHEAPRRVSIRFSGGCEVWRRPAGRVCSAPRAG